MESMVTRLMTQADVYTLLALASHNDAERARYARLAQELVDRAIQMDVLETYQGVDYAHAS